ncbi:MAG: glycoside hydrolase family 3 C-terminal domain-containing protein [Pseudoflavonifractor capillosus]|uniref:glycoside hydrolase family 3 protein n=1 Tax=Pseudoflavonifractor capillosus TaxID=106588 RepID=UPI0023F6F4D2|nr:glycoside hydrolase family 3 protein [Pseudoflavonifractor capillosus]MCI5927488.1 glycoside hydrolase family 3 C-terminal domain-containing protein [Pseudoflavonifractor capillosus]MDY4661515.1 glycoside hydrolase family 3 C-terminal domain-containing protein [Pseudoflavonifractor capillosus]
MTGIQIAWEDVFSVISQISGWLIGIGVTVVALILILIFAGKAGKPHAGFIRAQSAIAAVLIVALMVNGILLGQLSNLITSAFTEMGTLSEETIGTSQQTVEDVMNEGIVLLENDGTLPLDSTANLNVFGWASTNPVYGGTGSGSGTVDASTAVSLLSGLENAGFSLNQELSDFYTAYRSDRPEITINNGQDWTLPEPTADSYTDEMLENARAFSDTALIVFSRPGGEGADLPNDMGAVLDGSYNQGTKYTNASYQNNGDYADFEAGSTYLELSRTERDLVDLVTANFEKVIIVYNGSNPLELGWTEDYEQIRGVLVCSSPGATGFNSLGNILSGAVNPSGKTVDTWLRDVSLSPTSQNVGHFAYDNVQEITQAAKAHWERADGVVSFVNYVEGIYVGYRFYETAYAEALENGFAFDYDETVMYPFGYGLSYTTFTQELGEPTITDTTVTVDVTVTNTGSVAGKDVVELYYTPPYTNGGIEKSEVNLAAFGKTSELAPNQSEVITLSFDLEDMASFDTYGTGCYVLEAGTYTVSLRTDAHTVVDSFDFTLASTIVYDEDNLHNGDLTVADSKLGFAEGEVTYLSRADGFANYAQAVAAPSSYSLPDGYEVTGAGTYDVYQYNNDADVMPTTGADNGLELVDLRGLDYDDPLWDQLLDQMTISEMVDLIAYGGYGTVEAPSVGKIATLDADGPAGVNSSVTASYGMGYCGEISLAQTWNTDLAYEYAYNMLQEFIEFGFNGWYAPSMNMHRSPFGGRNFEYYSEDSLLSAEMAVAECQAAYDHDVYPYIKHFAFNEQEINRNGMLCTWLTEQSAREIYLKPFEACVKASNGNTLAVMSSYNYVGTTWAGACSALLNDILRGEWGFQGMVLTDYFGNYGYMDADKAIRGGSDAMLGTAGNDAILTDQTSATSVLAMRNACHNILYTVANSRAYSPEVYMEATAMPAWQVTVFVVDGVLAAILIVLEALTLRGYLKKKKVRT